MNDLKRNQRTVHYALYRATITNSDGEMVSVYGEPVTFKAVIGEQMGKTMVTKYGLDVLYDCTMTTHDMSCPVDENTVLCINVTPTTDADGYMTNYDYIVTKRAPMLNCIVFALKRVNVS